MVCLGLDRGIDGGFYKDSVPNILDYMTKNKLY